MFDFDAGKIVIVGVIALIFIPPKDLPRVMRQVGQFVGKMRRMAAEFQGQFMDAMREADMADLKQEAQKLSDAARVSTGLDTLHDLNREVTGALDQSSHVPTGDIHAAPPAEAAAGATQEPDTAAHSSHIDLRQSA
jgi:sec-independent protein translocase protein TatB